VGDQDTTVKRPSTGDRQGHDTGASGGQPDRVEQGAGDEDRRPEREGTEGRDVPPADRGRAADDPWLGGG
jgi:hypothetical protein